MSRPRLIETENSMVVETETLQRVSLTSGSILVEMGFILHKSNVILWQVVNSVLFILLFE